MKFINRPRTAIIIGATGLVGDALLMQLKADISFKRIIVFSRRALEIEYQKVEVVETDFINIKNLDVFFKEADVVFCCIGTTLKKAGSKEEFRKIDYDIPVRIAEAASKCHVRSFVVISSLGADPNSRNFYLKTKGEMERDVAGFKFIKLAFVRPSMLLGHRKDFRLLERVGQVAIIILTPIFLGPFKKFRPIHDSHVAKAMIQISTSASNQKVYESSELEWLGD